jgi:hypothetical protein
MLLELSLVVLMADSINAKEMGWLEMYSLPIN